MALFHGKKASIYWDSQGVDTELQHAQSWSLTATKDTVEVTAMKDTWKTYLSGNTDWTATVTCLTDTTGTDITLNNAGAPDGLGQKTARLELYFLYSISDYKSLFGNAICTGISENTDVNGVGTVTYSFQGYGQLLWDTGIGRP